MRNKSVATVRQAITKVTRMLSSRDVEVTQRGDQAYVKWDRKGNLQRVNIPYLPDTASEELIAAVQGFLDHEVAHILFTDPNAREDPSHPAFARIDKIHNMVEDCWIEPKMTKLYKGSAVNISRVRRLVFQKRSGAQIEQEIAEQGGTLPENMAIRMMLVALLRALAGQDELVEFMDEGDKWSFFPTVLPKLDFFKAELDACTSSHDTLEVARHVYNALIEEELPEEEPEEEKDKEEKDKEEKGDGSDDKDDKDDSGDGSDDKDDSGDGSDDKDDSGDGAGDEKSDKADDETDDEAGADDDEFEKIEGDESSGGKGEDSDADAGKDESSEGEPDGDNKDDIGEDGDLKERDENRPPETHEIESALDYAENFEKAAGDMILELSRVDFSEAGEWLVFTEDYNDHSPYETSSHFKPQWFTEMSDLVTAQIGPMQKELERLLLSRKRHNFEPGRTSGRLNPSALHRLRAGDPRVFRKKHETRIKNTAVSLVVDLSGSMGNRPGSRLAVAMEAAYALALTLERCRIPVQVTGFTTKDAPRKLLEEQSESEKRLGLNYSTGYDIHYQPVFKSWQERMTPKVSNRFADMRYDANDIISQNIDPLAVEWAVRDVMRRSEERKVVMVLSDGQPAYHGDIMAARKRLKESVQAAEQAGVETVGIGIQTDAVAQYYPRYTAIDSVNQLGTAVMGELRRILLK